MVNQRIYGKENPTDGIFILYLVMIELLICYTVVNRKGLCKVHLSHVVLQEQNKEEEKLIICVLIKSKLSQRRLKTDIFNAG